MDTKPLLELDVGAAVGALSRLPDGRLLVGPLYRAGVAVDVDTGAVTRLGPDGRVSYGRVRALAGKGPAPMVGVEKYELAFVDFDGRVVETRKTGFQRAYGEIERFAVDPRGAFAAVNPPDGIVRLHDVAKGRNHALKGLGEIPYDVVFDPGGTRVAALTASRRAMAWDLATKKPVADLSGPAPASLSLGLAFTAAGDRLLANLWNPPADGVGAATYTLAVYDLATGAVERVIPITGSIEIALLGADRVLACTAAIAPLTNGVAVHSLADGARLGLLSLPALQRHLLALDDDRFAVGGDDGVVRVYSARSLTAPA